MGGGKQSPFGFASRSVDRSGIFGSAPTLKASVFDELTKHKYRFPVSMVTEEDWAEKLA
jgi:hypothetical protein